MRKIFVCSPLSQGSMKANIWAAQQYCKFVVQKEGHIPLAPHIYFTQFLDDTKPYERYVGLANGITLFLENCDELWYFDHFKFAHEWAVVKFETTFGNIIQESDQIKEQKDIISFIESCEFFLRIKEYQDCEQSSTGMMQEIASANAKGIRTLNMMGDFLKWWQSAEGTKKRKWTQFYLQWYNQCE